jgi:hypothetical protein
MDVMRAGPLVPRRSAHGFAGDAGAQAPGWPALLAAGAFATTDRTTA